MLRKMLFQGLLAAAVIAGGASLYAVTTTAQPAQIIQAGTATAGQHDRHQRDDAHEYRKHRDDRHADRKHNRDRDDHSRRKHKRDHDHD